MTAGRKMPIETMMVASSTGTASRGLRCSTVVERRMRSRMSGGTSMGAMGKIIERVTAVLATAIFPAAGESPWLVPSASLMVTPSVISLARIMRSPTVPAAATAK
eukprot:Amastigsp_a678072_205.p3 type:complete len:105 gc:universal Amastigsp_a678072_205:906-592(-)